MSLLVPQRLQLVRKEVALDGFVALGKSCLVAVAEMMCPDEPEVAHRELRQTFLDTTEEQEQQESNVVRPALHAHSVGRQQRC